MEFEKIENLMLDMGKYNVTSIDIELPDGTKIKMKKDALEESKIVTAPIQKEVVVTNETVVSKGKVIKSPMVGTFYSKPSPNANPYVQVGKKVQKGEVLCIVEAMKLMNEIESEYDGTIKEILLKDGDSVEYGTELFVIE